MDELYAGQYAVFSVVIISSTYASSTSILLRLFGTRFFSRQWLVSLPRTADVLLLIAQVYEPRRKVMCVKIMTFSLALHSCDEPVFFYGLVL